MHGRIALFGITVDVVRTVSLESNSRIKYVMSFNIRFKLGCDSVEFSVLLWNTFLLIYLYSSSHVGHAWVSQSYCFILLRYNIAEFYS